MKQILAVGDKKIFSKIPDLLVMQLGLGLVLGLWIVLGLGSVFGLVRVRVGLKLDLRLQFDPYNLLTLLPLLS